MTPDVVIALFAAGALGAWVRFGDVRRPWVWSISIAVAVGLAAGLWAIRGRTYYSTGEAFVRMAAFGAVMSLLFNVLAVKVGAAVRRQQS